MPLTLDPDFQAHVDEIELTSTAAADAVCLLGQRKWHYPPLNTWSGNPLDITGTTNAFLRTNLNQEYVDAINDIDQQSTVGDGMVLKLQIDYIAALERAFRTRHASSVRCKIHAAARRRGMGDSGGVFSGNVVLWLTRLIEAAHDDPFAGP